MIRWILNLKLCLNNLLFQRDTDGHPPNYIVCVDAVVCILALFLPPKGKVISNNNLLSD